MSKAYACIISQNTGTDADALLAIAYGFAYRVEMLADGVLFDVSGLEKLIGDDKKIARKIVKELENNEISGNVAVAASVETALLLARENRGLNHTAASTDAFRQLPLRNLAIDRDTVGVFEALGYRIEDLDQIPADELTARYGHDFREVIDVIAQQDKRATSSRTSPKQAFNGSTNSTFRSMILSSSSLSSTAASRKCSLRSVRTAGAPSRSISGSRSTKSRENRTR
ncbi:MAG: hypothetical protein IPG67_14875 [Acidobacteria bacterium]|nr:hypothetical protein [Acidobacteriota bacterium]